MIRLRTHSAITIAAALMLILFIADVCIGSVDIAPAQVWNVITGAESEIGTRTIILNIRMVKAFVAILVGAALSVSGLQMQTLFGNPLAGPYVLGISSGASLGVALVVLAGFGGGLGSVAAAWIGCGIVLATVAVLANRLKDIMVILILGMMFSSGVGAIVQILQYLSHEDALKSFVVWTMGSLSDVTATQLWTITPAVVVGLILALISCKSLNMLLLGEDYAVSMGLHLKRSRNLIFLSTCLLAGTVTAYCGPIGFIGLAVPHVARYLIKSSDHRLSLPMSIFVGADIMLVCDILSKTYALPINALTALIGIPIVIWVVINTTRKRV